MSCFLKDIYHLIFHWSQVHVQKLDYLEISFCNSYVHIFIYLWVWNSWNKKKTCKHSDPAYLFSRHLKSNENLFSTYSSCLFSTVVSSEANHWILFHLVPITNDQMLCFVHSLNIKKSLLVLCSPRSNQVLEAVVISCTIPPFIRRIYAGGGSWRATSPSIQSRAFVPQRHYYFSSRMRRACRPREKIYRQFDIFNRVSLYSAENTNRRQGLMSLTHYSSEWDIKISQRLNYRSNKGWSGQWLLLCLLVNSQIKSFSENEY